MKGSADVKRIIIIPLIVLLIVSTSISVLALPNNVVTLEIPIDLSLSWYNNNTHSVFWETYNLYYISVNNDFVRNFLTGNIYFHFWDNWYDDRVGSNNVSAELFSLKYGLTVPGDCDIVIALPSSSVLLSRTDFIASGSSGVNLLVDGSAVSFTKLYTENYTDIAYRLKLWLNSVVTGGENQDLRAYMWDGTTATNGMDGTVAGSTFTIPMTFYSVSDIDVDSIVTIEAGYNGMYKLYSDLAGKYYRGLPFGLFVTDYEALDLFGSWYDPSLPFLDNVSSINTTLKVALEGTSSIYEKIFFSNYAQYQLDSLANSSNLSYMDEVNLMASQLDIVLDTMSDVNSDLGDYRVALNEFSDIYVEALRTAETPEQGEYITSVYKAKQEELYQRAIINANMRLTEVVTAEDINAVRDLNSIDKEFFSELSLQRLQDVVYYQDWFNLASNTDAMIYRSVIEWFFKDASFNYWLIIPMTFGIVSVLLGTTIRFSSKIFVHSHRDNLSRKD